MSLFHPFVRLSESENYNPTRSLSGCTEQGLLSKLLGLFDPMELAAPFTLKGKIRMQKLVIAGVEWDDLVPEGERKWWK